MIPVNNKGKKSKEFGATKFEGKKTKEVKSKATE